MTFNEWFKSCNQLNSESDELDCYLAWHAALRNDSRGIKAHDGQKLLVQIVLDNDKGLSYSSRIILEKLIE